MVRETDDLISSVPLLGHSLVWPLPATAPLVWGTCLSLTLLTNRVFQIVLSSLSPSLLYSNAAVLNLWAETSLLGVGIHTDIYIIIYNIMKV